MSEENILPKDKNLVLCACGKCGKLMPPTDKQGRKHYYLPGHNPNIRKRTKALSKKYGIEKKSISELITMIDTQTKIIQEKDKEIQDLEQRKQDSGERFISRIHQLKKEITDKDNMIREFQEFMLEYHPDMTIGVWN